MEALDKEKILKKIYDDYYQRLCFYASRHIGNFNEAKDIVQEICIKVWEKEVDFENDYALSAYLYSAVYHACLDRLELQGIHDRHHRHIQQEEEIADYDNYLNERIENEVWWELFKAIDSLPEECQKVIKLSYVEGLEINRVAEELGISTHTVKSQRARGKKLLQERLKGLFPLAAFLFFN